MTKLITGETIAIRVGGQFVDVLVQESFSFGLAFGVTPDGKHVKIEWTQNDWFACFNQDVAPIGEDDEL